MGAHRRALRRVADDAWPLLQATAAATLAWVIAKYVLDHDEPFFAPVAAVIALNATTGERGLNAVRLLQGVVVGIVVGAGIALVFTQLLFSPEPLRLLRRAESAALADMGKGLELTADALERDDDELAEEALTTLRQLRDRLVELARTRQASTRVSRRSAVWRSQRAPVVRETENAGYLDLLGGSCLMLTRAALAAEADERRELADPVRGLARALTGLALDPGDRLTRQGAVERVLDVARETATSGVPADPALAAIMAVRTVASDALMFAGVEPEQAVDAVQEGTGQFDIPTPPPAPRVPPISRRRRPTK